MVSGEIDRLFQCVICGVAWGNIQSLRAHMKIHKGEYLRTSIQVKKESWEAFNKLCEDHKTTTCHVLNTLVEGIVEGGRTGNIDLPKILSPNPLIINMTHVFLGKPRSSWKVDVSDLVVDKNVCHVCGGRVVRERRVESTGLIEGSCLTCRAEWLIKKGEADRP